MADNRSRELRRLAADCLALARQTPDLQVRTSLLEMARLDLAELSEHDAWNGALLERARLDLAELSEYDTWNEALRLRALQAAIGEGLRVQCELPRELPHRILALLMQLNGQSDAEEAQ